MGTFMAVVAMEAKEGRRVMLSVRETTGVKEVAQVVMQSCPHPAYPFGRTTMGLFAQVAVAVAVADMAAVLQVAVVAVVQALRPVAVAQGALLLALKVSSVRHAVETPQVTWAAVARPLRLVAVVQVSTAGQQAVLLVTERVLQTVAVAV
jgi:hypothetical protein